MSWWIKYCHSNIAAKSSISKWIDHVDLVASNVTLDDHTHKQCAYMVFINLNNTNHNILRQNLLTI